MSITALVLLTVYLSVGAAYWLCAFLMDGPWRGWMHAWLLLNVLLWPTFPFFIAGRWLVRRVTVTRNTAKTAPPAPGARSPEELLDAAERSSEESARRRGGSSSC